MALNEHKDQPGGAERDRALDRLYQAGRREEPPAALDAAIRAAARREAGSGPRAVSRLRAWRVPVSLAAVLVLSASLVMLMREEGGEALVHPGQPGAVPPAPPSVGAPVSPQAAPEAAPAERRALEGDASLSRSDSGSGAARRDSARGLRGAGPAPEAAATASAPPPVAADVARTAPAERSQAADDRSLRAPAVTAEPRSAPPVSRVPELAAGSVAESARQAPASSPTARPLMKSAPRSESEPPGDMAAELPRPAPAPPSAKPAAPQPQYRGAPARKPAPRSEDRQGELGASGGREAAPAPVTQEAPRVRDSASAQKREGAPPLSPRVAALARELDAQPPEKWLARVEALKREGRVADGDELMAEFRRRFPAYR